jgi:cell shape-determining protein MreC
VFAALSAALMVMDHKYKSLESVRASLSVVIYPIQLLVDVPDTVSEWFSESLTTRRHLQEENESLRTQIFMQNAQMQKLAALEAENIRLRELLDSSFEVGEKVIIAISQSDRDGRLLSAKFSGARRPLTDATLGWALFLALFPLTWWQFRRWARE